MDILTLELFDVTVSQALVEVRDALDRHPGLPLRILVGSDELVRTNLLKLLERQGRASTQKAAGRQFQLDVAAGSAPAPLTPAPLPQAAPATAHARPVVLLRSAFAPGDRALGRQLLLGVLETLPTTTPWLVLAHDALELLEDPLALASLRALEQQGIPVRLSMTSLIYRGLGDHPFPSVDDGEWQTALGRGEITVV